MKSFVYILQSQESGKFYIGSTINLEQRLRHHQTHSTPSTHRLGNMRLVFFQKYETLSQARKIEYRLKRLKRRDYIEKIVKDGVIKMSL